MSVAAKRAASLALIFAVWPGWAWGASTAISSQVCTQSFATTTLTTTEPTPTANASAAMSGTAEPNSAVNITVNGVIRATLTANPAGAFAASVALAFGSNVVVATADDGAFCGHTSSSPSVQIYRNQIPPAAPYISAPVSGNITTAASVVVQGSTDPFSTLSVTVNGAAAASVTVGSDGLFAVTVPLAIGSNTIAAAATNAVGSGPLSAPVTVTRQPVTVQQPAPPPAIPPAAIPGPATSPSITSPTNGSITTAASIIIQIQGQPGATAVVRRGETIVSTVRLDASGSAEVSIPLIEGDNELTVTTGGQTSPTITVRRQAPAPSPPIITLPVDGLTTSDTSITVAGQAPPGLLVTIFVGKAAAATVVADSAGQFSASVNLPEGLSLIYAQISPQDGTQLRSSIIQVDRLPAVSRGVESTLRTSFADLMTLLVAAILLLAQAFGAVLGAFSDSPLAVGLTISLAILVSSVSRGLLGLELLLLLPGLWRLRYGAAQRSTGQVVDTVTGRPLALSNITSGSSRQTLATTGRDGRFSVARHIPFEPLSLRANRPGFQSAGLKPGIVLALEPAGAHLSAWGNVVDALFGVVSWAIIGFATALGVYLAINQPGPLSLLVAIFSLGIFMANIILIIHQPRYRWGRITGPGGIPSPNVSITLTDTITGRVVSDYQTDASGRYTVHAPSPGNYRLTVSSHGHKTHSERVTVRRRATYLGWPISINA